MIYRRNSYLRERLRNIQSDVIRIQDNPIEILKSKETTDFLEREERSAIERLLIEIYKSTVWDIEKQEWIIEEFKYEFTEREMATIVQMIGKLTTTVKRLKKIPYEKTWIKKKDKGPVGNQFINLDEYYY